MKFLSRLFLPVLILIVIWIFLVPVFKSGLIVGSDWTFPYTSKQLANFYNDGFNLWSNSGNPLGFESAHKNLYLFQLFSLPFLALGANGILFQKAFVTLVFITMAISSYWVLNMIFKNPFASFLGSLVYIFSPIVFNYLNMGWIFVLFFIALLPILSYQIYSYINDGFNYRPFFVGVLTSIAFFQSQAIIWIPLLILASALVNIKTTGFKVVFLRTTKMLFVTLIMIFIVNMNWIIPSFYKNDSYISATTSSNDLNRFSQLSTFSNQLRGWGSLFNEHFELSLKNYGVLSLFSFTAILFGLMGLIINKGKVSRWTILGGIFVITPPFLYAFRDVIGAFPFSNIVRDVSRFMVISNFGIAILVANFVQILRHKISKLFVISLLLLSIIPYLFGELYIPKTLLYGVSQFGKDQRARLLTVPLDENERLIQNYQDKTNLFFPTGGFISSFSDNNFKGTYAEIGDIEEQFSPYGSGIYISDKSDQAFSKFSTNYLKSAKDNQSNFLSMSRIYSIDNIFIRKGLVSNFGSNVDSTVNFPTCIKTELISSDWSIDRICHIENSYPLFYLAPNPKFQGDKPIGEYIDNGYYGPQPNAVFRCLKDSNCSFDFKDSKGINEVNQPIFTKKSNQKYLVKLHPSSNPQMLVFNQTYHRGWILINLITNKQADYPHVIANDMVNGWVIPPLREETSFDLEFYPQQIYISLYPISLSIFIFCSSLALLLYLKSKKNEK